MGVQIAMSCDAMISSMATCGKSVELLEAVGMNLGNGTRCLGRSEYEGSVVGDLFPNRIESDMKLAQQGSPMQSALSQLKGMTE